MCTSNNSCHSAEKSSAVPNFIILLFPKTHIQNYFITSFKIVSTLSARKSKDHERARTEEEKM